MGFVEYKVHSALAEDSNEGRIWIKHKDLEEKIRGKRRIVCIKGKMPNAFTVKRYSLMVSIWTNGRNSIGKKDGQTPNSEMMLSSLAHGTGICLELRRSTSQCQKSWM